MVKICLMNFLTTMASLVRTARCLASTPETEDVKAKYEDGVLSVIVPKEDVKKLASSTAIAIE